MSATKPEYVLTQDVDCPWCIAKAGEPCWDFTPGFRDRPTSAGFQRRDGQVHMARVKRIDISSNPEEKT